MQPAIFLVYDKNKEYVSTVFNKPGIVFSSGYIYEPYYSMLSTPQSAKQISVCLEFGHRQFFERTGKRCTCKKYIPVEQPDSAGENNPPLPTEDAAGILIRPQIKLE